MNYEVKKLQHDDIGCLKIKKPLKKERLQDFMMVFTKKKLPLPFQKNFFRFYSVEE